MFLDTKPARRFATAFVVPALFLFLNACSESGLNPLPLNGTILAFGDSLTAGTGVKKEHSYPTVLSELSGRSVINAGVSGEITANGLLRLDDVLSSSNPDLMILLEGGNDILRGRDLGQAKANLASMITMARDRGIDVVLVGVPARNLFSDSASFYQELADEYNLVFEGELVASLLRTRKYKSDSVHFNQQGYRVMAEALHGLLIDEGAL